MHQGYPGPWLLVRGTHPTGFTAPNDFGFYTTFSSALFCLSHGYVMACTFPSPLVMASARRVHFVHHVCMIQDYHFTNTSGGAAFGFGARGTSCRFHSFKWTRLFAVPSQSFWFIECIGGRTCAGAGDASRVEAGHLESSPRRNLGVRGRGFMGSREAHSLITNP